MQSLFSGKQEVYIEIAQRYREYIMLGLLSYGEKMPSVRTAAGELGVNPNTVARAYSELEAEGLIQSVPKKGVYVIYKKDKKTNEPDKKSVIFALRDMGISRETVLEWIEEAYDEND